MKYILRSKETGCYLKRVGVWVRRMQDAMTFDDTIEVREYCQGPSDRARANDSTVHAVSDVVAAEKAFLEFRAGSLMIRPGFPRENACEKVREFFGFHLMFTECLFCQASGL
jgi:hypothetical protein